MNTIFVDFNHNNMQKNKDANKYNVCKYLLNYDILNNNFSKNIFILLDKEYMQKQVLKNKFSIYYRILKNKINSKFKSNEKVNVLFSKELDKYTNIKDYILSLLKQNSVTLYEEVIIQNRLKQNDIQYIDKFIESHNISMHKLKILVVFDDIKDYDNENILKYIAKYKFVDILVTNRINKIEINKIRKNIIDINNEYGTTIEIIKKRNLQKYNVYLIYSDIDKLELNERYILSSESLYIEMNNVDYDILNENYIKYQRFEKEILTLLKRLNINKENFIQAKLGYVF